MNAKRTNDLAANLRQAWKRRELTFGGDHIGGLDFTPHKSLKEEKEEFRTSYFQSKINPETGARSWSIG